MNIAIYGKDINSQEEYLEFHAIFKVIDEFGWKPVVEKNLKSSLSKWNSHYKDLEVFTSTNDFHSGIDFALSAGGDGTFIKTIGYVRQSNVPIIGVNLGRLGYLANINQLQVKEAFILLQEKKYKLLKRSLICVETERHLFGQDNFALNEVTVHRKDTASMITVHTEVDGEYLNNYWADGLIVATPSGSTAYSLSCGGPIVEPSCQVHLLTPIAAHNLNVRPMILSNQSIIKLKVSGRAKDYLVSLDSKTKSIQEGEEIIIKKNPFTISTIEFENSSFMETIRNKMLWGLDKRNY